MRLPETTTPAAWATILALPIRRVSSRVRILDRDEKPVGSFLPISSGGVTIDASAAVTRSADLVAVDPRGLLGFDAGSPADGALYADRFVQIDYGIVDAAGVIAWTPIFRGPVVRYERAHPEIRISAQGKESLLLAPNLPFFKGTALHLPRGLTVSAAIQKIATAVGEQETTIPEITKRIGKVGSLGRTKEPWKTIRAIASDAGYQAFYDGAGRLVVRKIPAKPVWTFDRDVLTYPTITFDLGGEFRNVVRVVGKTPAGKKTPPPSKTEEPPANDPLSPKSLARNGVPRVIGEYLEVDTSSQPTVNGIAKAELGRRMKQSVQVGFDALTVPGLEEGDPCVVVLPGAGDRFPFTAQTFSIGLGVDQMSIGTTQKVRLRRLDK